ncbi:MAG: PilZ domain-containing protein [bacterium]|nr:PilZ domain-containing protein [bacterium]
MEIKDLKEIKKVKIFIDNEKIMGEIIDVDNWGKMIISVPQMTKTVPVELGKRGEIFFEKDGIEFFISGKIFSQGIERIFFIPETDILKEKRKNERYETPFVKCILTKEAGKFHKEIISGNVLNISLSGAKIETNLPLNENSAYIIKIDFTIRNKIYPFSARCKLKYIKKMRTVFLNGVEFIEFDYLSLENLKKYLLFLERKFEKDALNY